MKLNKLFFAVVFFFIAGIIFAGPFGLDMGMSLEQLRSLTGENPELIRGDFYEINPPNGHDMFESYLVQVSPKYGVVMIKAIGKDITTNGHGTQLKSAFNNLVASIERTYGKYEKIDYLLRGSIWDEPEDFMMGIVREDRYLLASWGNEAGSTLPADISLIGVVVSASSSSKGWINLEYYSPNKELADNEKQAEQDAVF